ncbi:MAG: LytTR family DNA-binding domain-containing protein [Bacteroidota bacterium]
MINCIALDDEPMALEVIKAHSEKLPFINLSHSFTQISAARKHLKKFPVDLIFLDIQMPDMNGIDFYKNLEQNTMVVFTTAYSQYAVEGFNVNAIDYLLKPIEFERFETACIKAKDYFEFLKASDKGNNNCLYVRSEYALVKIPFSEILFLETMDDYIKIHRKEKDTVITLSSMKKIMEKLPEKDFIRVHRSFSVRVDKIENIRAKKITVENNEIPIGKSYEKTIMSNYSG